MDNVEMIIRGKSAHNAMRHQAWARRKNFLFSVRPEMIKVTRRTVQRKNEANMTPVEREKFLNGIEILITSGDYGSLVAFHVDMSFNQHPFMGELGRQRFLGWHRVYLFELEQMLIAHDPDCFIPYWDWTTDRKFPAWLADFKPTVDVNTRRITVTRRIGVRTPQLPTKQAVDSAMNSSTHTGFTDTLDPIHGTVHNWVGGTMADIQYSPTDPVFFLHHGNIDRLWSLWQKDHPGQNALLVGQDAIFTPWQYDEQDTREVADFDYLYV